MSLVLSKMVPAHRRTVEFTWLKRDFMVMTPQYREIRARCHSPMDTCFWCVRKLVDGEMMALAGAKKGANKILCQDCAALMVDAHPANCGCA